MIVSRCWIADLNILQRFRVNVTLKTNDNGPHWYTVAHTVVVYESGEHTRDFHKAATAWTHNIIILREESQEDIPTSIMTYMLYLTFIFSFVIYRRK